MLIYNDQKDETYRNEETFGMLIPEDNFWRRVNRAVDFEKLGAILEDKYNSTIDLPSKDLVRCFKYLLLGAYKDISDEDLIEKTKTDLVFRYFLEYDPLDMELLDASILIKFRNIKVDENFISNSMKAFADVNIGLSVDEFKDMTMQMFAEMVLDGLKNTIGTA